MITSDHWIQPHSTWKVYFWFALMLTLLGYSVSLVDPDEGGFQRPDIVDLLSDTLGIAGVFGFAFSKRLIRALFWKICFPPLLCWDLYRLVVEFPLELFVDAFDPFVVVATGALVLFGVPFYVALYLYAYSSAGLWSSPRTS